MFNSFRPMDYSHQAPLSMEFSRQEYWSGLPFPSPGNLPNPGIKHGAPTFQVNSLHLSHWGRLPNICNCMKCEGYYSQWNKLLTKHKCHMIPLSCGTWRSQNRNRDGKCNGSHLRLWGGEKRKLLFSGYRVSVLQDEKSSEDGWWWGLHKNIFFFTISITLNW